MITEFVYELRARKVPVGAQETVALARASRTTSAPAPTVTGAAVGVGGAADGSPTTAAPQRHSRVTVVSPRESVIRSRLPHGCPWP